LTAREPLQRERAALCGNVRALSISILIYFSKIFNFTCLKAPAIHTNALTALYLYQFYK
jgi:hypothetical protein